MLIQGMRCLTRLLIRHLRVEDVLGDLAVRTERGDRSSPRAPYSCTRPQKRFITGVRGTLWAPGRTAEGQSEIHSFALRG
jgi:hypothetical protein